MKRTEVVRWLDRRAPRVAKGLRRGRTWGRRLFALDAIAAHRTAVLEGEPWTIDDLVVDGDEVRIRGWAFAPGDGGVDARPQFTVNAQACEGTLFHNRGDVADRFWNREGSSRSGFAIRYALHGRPAFPGGYLEVDYVNSPAPLPHGLGRAWYLRDPSAEAAFPSSDQRRRVFGNDDLLFFRLSGATDFRRLAAAIRAATGKALDAHESILDWGCGCGRVARYASGAAPRAEFSGCDIDKENAAWCSRNLRGSYHWTSMRPPLPFPDATFDLVYGVSVLTHLREELQDAWLEELRRVVRPGGHLCVTFHGRTAIDYAGLEPRDYASLLGAVEREGIFVAGSNSQLDGATEDAGEYLNVFHSQGYVRDRWSRWFDVRAIYPGYIYTHDLVVMQRPG